MSGNEKRILLIDDKKEILLDVTIALAGRGMEIFYASSVDAGLQKIKTGPHYDLIILDIMMEGDSGLRCLDIFREMQLTIPVLVYTALSDWRTVQSALLKGATYYLPKSGLLNNEFVATVDRLIYGEKKG